MSERTRLTREEDVELALELRATHPAPMTAAAVEAAWAERDARYGYYLSQQAIEAVRAGRQTEASRVEFNERARLWGMARAWLPAHLRTRLS